ncbi:DUF1080 domain-containing protein [Novosphingobium sp. PASSN1]|uniref:3-keto-disaccharide hydrolase n=1 Tax=Novosphingobium sp. PASSN1 TaxID=2015561 RepID=UPI000BC6DDAA|nr:DUF1080 domain-containing protein [Novosphingobium sp. PASSN1]OYU35416.1 MAG: hypothetical protein CFE35_10610 [Novosphingobium sp. PASSN1]
MPDRREVLRGSLLAALAGAAPARLLGATAAPPFSGGSWQPLFDGKSLSGWTFYQEGNGTEDRNRVVRIEQGMLHFLGPRYQGKAQPGHIATTTAWQDYHLRLDYKFGPRRFAPRALQRRNSGLLYHMGPERDRLFPDCVEFQIEEGDTGDAIMVNTLALQGPLLGGTPLWPNWIPAFPSEYQTPINAGGYRRQWHRHSGPYERLDDWNTLDLYAFGDSAAQLVNGRIVNTLFKMLREDAGGIRTPLTSGRIALEFEWAEVSFRNVMIRPLDAAAIGNLTRQGSE